jgi:putative ubiquitin-RnfH superfamily antitoxin RatB of RatAB toxin-antitoxin module
MDEAEKIDVEVAYALPERQVILPLKVDAGTSIEQAIQLSKISEMFPEIDLDSNKVGIFGKLRKPDEILRPGDRIEIYRPLIADPKEVRRKRASEGKVMKKGAGAINEDKDADAD